MNTGQWIIVGCLVPVFVALVTAIVELRKTRVTAARVEHEVRPNTGGSMRDAVDRATEAASDAAQRATAATTAIGNKLDRLSEQLHEVDKRLTRVETRTERWVPLPREGTHADVQ